MYGRPSACQLAGGACPREGTGTKREPAGPISGKALQRENLWICWSASQRATSMLSRHCFGVSNGKSTSGSSESSATAQRAEELTVETFWRIYRARSRFDPSRDFGPWCRRIATNLALGHLKSLRRQPAAAPKRWVEAPAANAELLRDPDPRIEQAFRRLSPRLQLTATLALIEEKPYQEIADALGTSIGTVKSRVFRSIRLLRKYLRRLGIEP